MSILGNMIGGTAPIKTLTIVDADGVEITGVVVDNEVIFDATPEDVKIGKIFASDDGVLVGTDTKTYRVQFSKYLIFPNEDFSIPLEQYDAYNYTQFQAIISIFNTTVFDSISATKIAIYDSIYNVGSNNKLSDIYKNSDTKSIDLNIVNNTENTYIIHFSTYKEE